MREQRVSESAFKPIRILPAMEHLSKEQGFDSVINDYDFLSNICHHNGSGHRLFGRGMRTTRVVTLRTGDQIVMPVPAVATTLAYPSPHTATSIVQTSKLVCACAAKIKEQLDRLPQVPFSDDDLARLTKGQLSSSMLRYLPKHKSDRARFIASAKKDVGRNDLCPCGSGKKFKVCCLPLSQ
ncbi:SEC-C metal-binding domain-containing protein [Microvirga sp. 3-52]|uniref:SEC-C metal-binding domain-containing protein n=1 Tax=Microvirga sp. 3-52 TaxID=2792425 RepID=UPI003908B20E